MSAFVPPWLRSDGRGWLLLTVGFGWFVVPAAFPQIRDDIGLTNAAPGVAITAISITYRGMQFPAGGLVDRRGHRPVPILIAIASVPPPRPLPG